MSFCPRRRDVSKPSDLTPQDLPAKKQFRGIYDCCGRQRQRCLTTWASDVEDASSLVPSSWCWPLQICQAAAKGFVSAMLSLDIGHLALDSLPIPGLMRTMLLLIW